MSEENSMIKRNPDQNILPPTKRQKLDDDDVLAAFIDTSEECEVNFNREVESSHEEKRNFKEKKLHDLKEQKNTEIDCPDDDDILTDIQSMKATIAGNALFCLDFSSAHSDFYAPGSFIEYPCYPNLYWCCVFFSGPTKKRRYLHTS